MRHLLSTHVAGFALTVIMLVAGPLAAQGQSGGGTWSETVAGTATAAQPGLDPATARTVDKVSAYFNALDNMKGRFVQTDPDKTRSRGRFYVKRPGRFRFDYAAPHKKIMASDGRLLRIKEPDQDIEDAVELDNTPFRLLLRKDVNLIRDAQIIDAQESDDLIILLLQDRNPDAPGRVQLFFVKQPELDLKEWVVQDPQGLETRVEVSRLNKKDKIDPEIFVWETNFFRDR